MTKVVLQITAQGAKQTVADIRKLQDSIDAVSSSSSELTSLARSLGVSFKQAADFAKSLGLSATQTEKAVAVLRDLKSTGADSATQFAVLNKEVGLSQDQFQALNTGLGDLDTSSAGAGKSLAGLAFQFNNIVLAAQTLASTLSGAFDLLIGQNERLNQEILSTQSSLVATTDVLKDGFKIEDPTEAINALEAPIRDAIQQIRADSLELVGVTSAELVPLFQILASNSGVIANQSAQWADPIEAASKLTVDFAATLGTLGVPLVQARQEINSILQGTVDSNSVIAKSLNINNQMVEQWRQQGTLVDELRSRLEPFVAGNALAAQSISGITSNIQEVLEEVTRVAGVPLFDEIVAQLQKVYSFIDANKETIAAGVTSAVDVLRNLMGILGEALARISEALLPSIIKFGEALQTALSAGSDAAVSSLETLLASLVQIIEATAPLLTLTANIANALAGLADTGIGQVVLQAGLMALALGKIAPALQIFITLTTTSVAAVAKFAVSLATLNKAALALQFKPLIAGLAALKGSILATTAAISPLALALAGLAIPLAIFARGKQLESVNDQVDAYGSTVKAAGDETFDYAQKIKELNDIRASEGELTEEQIAQLEQLKQLSQSRIDDNNKLIAAIDAVNPKNEAQANSLAALKQQLEVSNLALEKQVELTKESGFGDGVEVRARQLGELGDAYTQLAEKSEQAQKRINTAQNIDEAKAAAKERIDLVQQERELGQITADEAISRLRAVANNTKLTYEEQLAAQQAITQITEAEGDKRVDAVKRQQLDVEEAVANRQLSESEGERQLTQLKAKELETQLGSVRDALAEEKRERGNLNSSSAQQLLQQEEELETQLAQVRRDARGLERDAIQKEGEKRVQAVQREINAVEVLVADRQLSEIEGERRITDLRVKEIQTRLDATKQSYAAIAKEYGEASAQARQILQEQSELEAQLAQARATRREVEVKTIQEEGERRVSAVQREIDEVEILVANRQVSEIEGERQITELRLKEIQTRLDANRRAYQAIAASDGEASAQARQLLQEQSELEVQLAEVRAARRSAEIKAIEDEGNKRIEALQREQAQVQILASEGVLSRAESERQLTQITLSELQTRLENTKRVLAAEVAAGADASSERVRSLIQTQSEIAAQIAETQRKIQDEQNQRLLANYDEQLAIIEANFAERLISEEEYLRQKQQLQVGRYDEELRQLAEARQRLSATDKEGLDVLLAQEATIRAQRAEAIDQFYEEQLSRRQQQLQREAEVLRATIEATTEAIANMNAELDASAEVLDLQERLQTSRFNVEKARRGLAQTSAEVELNKVKEGLQIREQLGEEGVAGTEREIELRKELNELGLEGATSEEALRKRAAALSDTITRNRLEGLKAEFEQQRALLELDLQRQRIQAEQAVNQARIAQANSRQQIAEAKQEVNQRSSELEQARRNLERAQAGGDAAAIARAQDEFRSATELATLAQEQVALSEESSRLAGSSVTQSTDALVAQDELAENARLVLEYEQETVLAEELATKAAKEHAEAIGLAVTKAEALGVALDDAAKKYKPVEQKLAEIPGNIVNLTGGSEAPLRRRFGGAMEAGQPYWVGEGQGGRILPTSEIVVPGVSSYALAANKAQQWLKDAAPLRVSSEVKSQESRVKSNYELRTTNYELLKEVSKLRKDVQQLKPQTAIPPVNFYNSFSRGDEKAYLAKVRRQTVDLLEQLID